jgi:assimilatory nitrate reductase catalytic subunit
MTRTGMSPRLSAHTIEAYVEINPDDAAEKDIVDGELVIVSSPQLDAEANNQFIYARAKLSDKQQVGSLFIPMHWNDQFSSNCRVGTLIQSVVDPVSGQPESKHGIASIQSSQVNWYGFMITFGEPDLQYSSYWSRSRGKGFWRYELAGMDAPQDWSSHAHHLLGHTIEDENWLEFYDKSRNHYRAVRLAGNRLESCLFIYPDINLPPRDWLISLFNKDEITQLERKNLLTGEPPQEQEDHGKIICACFNVGEKSITDAIKNHGINTVEGLGEQLKAGTNCGSCKPELSELITQCGR